MTEPTLPVDSWTHRILDEVRVATAAAEAARAVPGVIRLQPGLVGLVAQIAAETWTRVTGLDMPDYGGVDVDLDPAGGANVRITVVTDSRHQAATVAEGIQRAVLAALAERTAPPAATVVVHVCDITIVE